MAAVQQPPLNVFGVKVPYSKIGQYAPSGHEHRHELHTIFAAVTTVAPPQRH